jgi:uncharacterized protein (TIGR00645 family)
MSNIWTNLASFLAKLTRRKVETQPHEDFDFKKLTGDLTNSITDEIYRQYNPRARAALLKVTKEGGDEKSTNDLEISGVASEIKVAVDRELAEKLPDIIAQRVITELEEQHFPKKGTTLELTAEWLLKARLISIAGLAGSAFVIIALSIIIFAKSLNVSIDAGLYFWRYTDLVVELFNVPASNITALDAKNAMIGEILSILDLILITSLAMMVFIGGYENVIGRVGSSHDYPIWIGKLEIGQLKIKVAASIIIISSLHLLLAFLKIDLEAGVRPEQATALLWTSIIHGVFVLSALMLAFIEWLSAKSH